MKIAVINNLYKPLDKGGAEKVSETIVNDLKKLNHNVFVITTKPKNLEIKKTDDNIHYINSNYYNLSKYSIIYRFFWHIFSFFDFKKMSQIGDIINKENPDIVITNNIMGLSPLSFLIIKTKHIHILHDIQLLHPSGLMFSGKERILNTLGAKIYQKINRKLIGSPSIVISPSFWLLEEYKKKNFFPNSEKIVLRNPIDIKREIFTEKKENETNFIFIGQIEKHKGILLLLKSWEKINKKNCKLIIVGDGSELKNIKEKYKDVQFTGRLNKEELKKELSKSHCLIMPSLCYENSPGVIYEASAFNIPVIASDIGGAVELIKEYKGLLFKTNDVEDLKEKIEYMHNNIDRYLEQETREIGEASYTEKIIKKAAE
ncbi:MAG: glycosyltransferase [Patescibacteria group bacterium]